MTEQPSVWIWWTSEQDCLLISSIYGTDPDVGEDAGPLWWPRYLAKQYCGRYGRNGRGRLWVAQELKGVDVSPWPETEFSRRLREHYAGIAIHRHDFNMVACLPGIITDTDLNVAEAGFISLSNVRDQLGLLGHPDSH